MLSSPSSIFVCLDHYRILVSRGKVNDYLQDKLHSCQMAFCNKPSYRRVLVGLGSAQTKRVSILSDGSIYEEVGFS